MMRTLNGRSLYDQITPPTRTTVADVEKNVKAISTLSEHCSLDIQDKFFDANLLAHQVWTKLEDDFGSTNTMLGMAANSVGNDSRSFLNTIDLLLLDIKYYKIQVSDFELITRFYSMLPLEHNDWRQPVYMQIPPGIDISHKPGQVFKLVKVLYGLKQTGFEWSKHLKGILESLGWKLSQQDPCLYYMGKDQFVLVYVDDILMITPSYINNYYNNYCKKAIHPTETPTTSCFKIRTITKCANRFPPKLISIRNTIRLRI